MPATQVETVLLGRLGNQLFIMMCLLAECLRRKNLRLVLYSYHDENLWPADVPRKLLATHAQTTLLTFRRPRHTVIEGLPPGQQRAIAAQQRHNDDEDEPTGYKPLHIKPPQTLVTGYRQHFNYFADHWPLLHKTLFVDALPPLTSSVPEDTVAVHVRRGDYAPLPHLHPILGDGYYVTALNTHFADNAKRIMVFCEPGSRDQVRAELFPLLHTACTWAESVEMFTDDTMSPLDEMRYMGTARMLVIANSSYSWWAGLLAATTTQDAKVVMPDEWFGVGAPRQWTKAMCAPPHFVVHPVWRPCPLAPAMQLTTWPDPVEVWRHACADPIPNLARDLTLLTADGRRVLMLPQIVFSGDKPRKYPKDVEAASARAAVWITTVHDRDVSPARLCFDLWTIMRAPANQTQFRNCIPERGTGVLSHMRNSFFAARH
jgi:hypothetical protein